MDVEQDWMERVVRLGVAAMRRISGWLCVGGVVVLSLVGGQAEAGWWWHHANCSPCEPAPCLVPKWEMEKRIVKEVICKPVERERTVQVCRTVVETKTVTRQVTTYRPVRETKVVQYTVRVPEWKEFERTVPVSVPKVIECQGVKRVCKRVPVTTTRTVCYDAGQWTCVTDKCGRVRKVWCPNIVTKEVPVTTYRIEWEEVPVTYKRVVYETKLTTRKVRVCNYRCEVRTKEIPCVRYEPQMVEKQVQVPVYKTVTEPKTVKYVEWVNEVVEREIEVPVCKWVPAEQTPPQPVQKSQATQKPQPTQK